ncbi:histidinol-phosphate aminotransferase 1, chloroplastic [Dunaliella salina]|uniref:histidinol-phosphate transaminase n=1 Tax=Dunaliella salina TaxID=3046 RepID=A0ABQ7GTK6_DUNSA|nr:histidinol-phosphate aminotransferase 1, chloroplastic [Dunaliella salina]|eukprot:KAF5837939.1 histidinol-phosphate aminotransferase 1, chloroplastic [Dunaliella salina]
MQVFNTHGAHQHTNVIHHHCSGKENRRVHRRMASCTTTKLRAATASDAETSSSRSGAPSTSFLRPHLLKLAPYTPIEPFEVLSQRFGRKPEDIIKLDANENPYGPPEEVRRALAEMPFPHVYPDPETRRLRGALAAMNDIPMEHLLVGCGADELIDLLMRCVLEPGDAILDCPPTFTMYAFDADVNNARTITIPRLEGFKVDIEGIRQAVAEHKPKAVFLTSPNNPDGSVMSEEEVRAVLELPVLVVLDEAYIEFSSEPSKIKWVQQYDNLVVLRTFSKSAALAGLRVGYGAFPLGMVEYLWRAKQPYNVSVAAEVAGCAALSNVEYMHNVRELLVSERENMMAQLKAIPYLEPYPSHANFILAKVVGRDAKDVKDKLAKEHGIMVRHYAKKELSGYVRISVGKPEHTSAIINALKAMA